MPIFKTIEKSEFHVLIKHCFLMGKSNGLISVIRTLLCWKQWLRGRMQSDRHKWCWTLRSPKFGSCPRKHKKFHRLILAHHKLRSGWYLKAVYSPFCMNISRWESRVQSGLHICSQSIKNNNVSTIQSIVCTCFNKK